MLAVGKKLKVTVSYGIIVKMFQRFHQGHPQAKKGQKGPDIPQITNGSREMGNE